MLPYFYKLDRQLLTPDERVVLANFASEHHEDFVLSIYKDGTTHFLEHCMHHNAKRYIQNHPIVARIVSSFMIKPTMSVMMLNPPNSSARSHIDDGKLDRITVLYVPLYPQVGYEPTTFWTAQDGTKVTETDYSELYPHFINTQQYHGIPTTHSKRICLQFGFNRPIEEIVDAYRSGQLFNI